jgi:subtilase family serine protease
MRHASVGSIVVGSALFAAGMLAAPAIAQTSFSAIPASAAPTIDRDAGQFKSTQMSVEVILAPRNQSEMSGLLTGVYSPNSPTYGHWLPKGQFNARFAPSSAQITGVATYLKRSGMSVERSASPFIVRASGSSGAVSAAFKTGLRLYRNARGTTYFANASAAQLPTNLASGVLGVVGLSNTVRVHSLVKRPLVRPTSRNAAPKASCEAPYPTRQQLFDAVNNGIGFPFGYGGAPGCSGLTPSQDNAFYRAPNAGRRGQGAGVNLAVFELSAYQRSDVTTWAHTFYGAGYRPPLVDIVVDGGPLSPICPAGDTCPLDMNTNGYSVDIEVDADIETQLAISPAASHIFVYNAPKDTTGQTELDEYAAIANDDLADVISSSWASCENDAGPSFVQAENVIFEQMALQGQSMFAAAGDTGPFECIRDGSTIPNTILNALDPASQPWVTGVGGTSFESANPGSNPHPAYPIGIETVWNVDNLCNASANEGGQPGLFWCAATRAGGGGNSQFWGRPFYQFGPRITNPYTAYGNGTTHCSLVAVGTPCREVPDISANADEYTPYGEYCTGDPTTNSNCATFSSGQTPAGWFGIGGTSLSSPLWSGIFADRDGYQGSRSGSANPLLYLLYNLNPHGYFNDITGIGQSTNNNGLFPTTPGYDLATGIGTPKMSAIITGFPQK